MMRISTLSLAVFLFGCSALGANDAKPSMDFVTRVAVGPGAKFVAVLDESRDGATVHVLSCCATSSLLFSIGPQLLAKFVEEPKIDSIEWSADGQLLKIAMNDRGEDYAIAVLELARGIESLHAVSAGEAPAAWGSWSTAGHRLYVTSTSEDDGGIYAVDPIAGTSKQLVKGYKIATDLSVTDTFLVTKVEESSGDSVTYALISIDLRTGAVKRLAP